MHDVGVRQENEFRSKLPCALDALLHRPELARPSRGKRLAADDRKIAGALRLLGSIARDFGSAVTAGIVDEVDVQIARLPRQQAGNAPADALRLIARGDDDGY